MCLGGTLQVLDLLTQTENKRCRTSQAAVLKEVMDSFMHI